MSEKIDAAGLLTLTANVVSSHLSNNKVNMSDLPQLLKDVYETLNSLVKTPEDVGYSRQRPAISVKRSVTPDYLICLEDGKKLKMLKRHLKTNYNMTPDEYRDKWGLAVDYPMVAPSYAARRSDLAKKIGLGVKKDGK